MGNGNRIVWIDALKGIGILFVCIGHYWHFDYAYLFHMPLFFIVSGLLFTPPLCANSLTTANYLIKATCRYLIPYAIFLTIMLTASVPIHTIPSLRAILYGGEELQGIFAIFWFITVLYCSIVFLIISSKYLEPAKPLVKFVFLLSLIGIGYWVSYMNVKLPWNMNVVPMAMGYIYLGYLIKDFVFSIKNIINRYSIVLVLLSALIVIGVAPFADKLRLDMKIADYGLPIISMICSLLMVSALIVIAILTTYRDNYISKALVRIGEASLLIMYLHMLFYVYGRAIGLHEALILLLTICFCVSLQRFIWRNRIISLLILGKYNYGK